MNSIPKLNFSRRLVYLKNELIKFDERPYLRAILASTSGNLVIRASRQVEKSTFLALTILYLAVVRPGIQLLYVCPRYDQAGMFVHSKLMPLLNDSPILKQALLGDSRRKPPVRNMRFINGSQLYVRAAYRSADSARGISADVLLIDEFQDLASGDLPVLKETLSHAEQGITIVCGTPKLVDNHLEAVFNQSTANEWMTTCPTCHTDVIPDERCLGSRGVACPKCQNLLDMSTGRWVARYPNAKGGEGFWLNYLMVPWAKDYEQVLEKQRVYDFAKFKNEVLGQPVLLGEHQVTIAELEVCCTDLPMAQSIDDVPLQFQDHIIAGIDWGGGGTARTVVAIGFLRSDAVFQICHFASFRADEDPDRVRSLVADLCKCFRVRWIGADGGGNGSVYNRLLVSSLPHTTALYGILYSGGDREPHQDGILWRLTVDRTGSLGHVFACVKKQKLQFPRTQDCGGFLDEFACEVAEWDDISRSLKYTHPKTQLDDALHATNYALVMASRLSNFTSYTQYL